MSTTTSVVHKPWLLGGQRGGLPPSLDLKFLAAPLDPRITFTRASTATYFDSGGTMQTAAMNLCLQSASAPTAPWTIGANVSPGPTVTGNQVVAPDGTTTGARAVYPIVSAASSVSALYQGFTATAAVYTCSVYLRGNVGGEQTYLYATDFGAAYSAHTRVTLTTAWQRFSITTTTLTAAAWAFGIGVDLRDAAQAGTSAQTIFVWGAQIELGTVATPYIPTTTAANGAPRFDYDPVTHALRGLLIEEARTNLLLSSANFASGGWALTGTTVTAPAGSAPDGTVTMTRLAETTGNNWHFVSVNLTLTASTQYTLSVFAKAAEDRYLVVDLDDTASNSAYATFDLQAGVISQALVGNGACVIGGASISPVGGGIYRCAITTSIGPSTTGRVLLSLSNSPTPGGFPVYVGNSANGMLIWGAQIEAGTLPTSYVPTTSAAVTRAADAASMPASSWRTNATAFSFAVDAILPALGSFPTYVQLDDTTNNNRTLLLTDAGNNLRYFENVGGVTTSNDTSLGTLTVMVPFRSAVSSAASAHRYALNGIANVSGGSAAAPPPVTTLWIGKGNGATQGTVYIRRLRYWPRVLSSSELQQVTR